jgi:hypothetical protein
VSAGRVALAAGALAAGALAAAALPGCGGDEGGGEEMSACGFSEPAGNHDFGRAAAYDLGGERMGCLAATGGAGAGTDFYAFDAPGDAAGGYVQLQVDAAGAGKLRAIVYGDDAGAELGRATAADAATPLDLVVAVAPGARYRLAVEDDSGAVAAPYAYRLGSRFAPVPDAFEPNDAPDSAALIGVGTPVDAFLFAGPRAAAEPLATLDDNYRVAMTGDQMITVRLEALPANVAARLFLFAPDGSETARVASGHRGEMLVMQPPLPAVWGDYIVRVSLWADPPPAVTAGTTPPPSFTQPYRLLVTQP